MRLRAGPISWSAPRTAPRSPSPGPPARRRAHGAPNGIRRSPTARRPQPTATPGPSGNRPPVVRLSASPTSGAPPLAVTFDAGASTDPEGAALQHSFLAGNTRSIFVKYTDTRNVSIHHNWVMKQWARGPLISTSVVADVRNNIIEDWTSWGVRFEKLSRGNLLHNLFVLGPTAKALGGAPTSALRLTTSGGVFTAGNVYRGLAANGPNGKAPSEVPAPPVTTLPVAEMA